MLEKNYDVKEMTTETKNQTEHSNENPNNTFNQFKKTTQAEMWLSTKVDELVSLSNI
jgi:hypothetical protein